jgi:hypothetical protein
MTRLRVASLNLHAYPNPRPSQIDRLARLIADQRPDIALLQECKKGWLDVVCEVTGLPGVYSHDVEPALAFPPDGCAVAVHPTLQIRRAWRVAPDAFQPSAVQAEIAEETPIGYEHLPQRLACRYSARSLLVELSVDDRTFVAASFHATPGTGKVGGQLVHEWKPFFHGGVALSLASLDLPFVFAIDANEPLSETVDSVTFHWAEGRPGQRKFAALLGLEPRHRARDLLRLGAKAAAGPNCLARTYATGGEGGERRFDSIWATPEFTPVDLTTRYEEALAAGGDHALLVANLTF